MNKWVADPKQQRDLDTEPNLDHFNRVEEKGSKGLIEQIQIDNQLKRSPGLKIVKYGDDCRSCCRIDLNLTLAERMGIPGESIVADSSQPVRGGRRIGADHLPFKAVATDLRSADTVCYRRHQAAI